ncbi:MAG TPA: hypothetical protein VK561_20130, partial [Bradyrhizobium sp.]|nr:hypothetical protein [Bradyrhizobium sp.]
DPLAGDDGRDRMIASLRAKQSIARVVIASEAKQSILPLRGEMDCFAALAMTVSCDYRATPPAVVARQRVGRMAAR